MEERKIVQEEIIRDLKLKLEKQVANGSNKTEVLLYTSCFA